jgi:acetyl esterase
MSDVDVQETEYQRVGNVPHLATVYRPRGQGPFPAVITVRGGGWKQGDRFSTKALDERLAAAGVISCALDFRDANVGKYPMSIEDVNTGIRWFKAHIREFQGLPNVGGIGCSSGGQQVFVNALRASADTSLAFVVGCWPVVDTVALHEILKAKDPQADTLCDVYFADRAAMLHGSPRAIIDGGGFTKPLPPVLIVQGAADDTLSPEYQQAFVDAHRRAGGQIEMNVYPGMPHSFALRQPDHPQSVQAVADIITFIKGH